MVKELIATGSPQNGKKTGTVSISNSARVSFQSEQIIEPADRGDWKQNQISEWQKLNVYMLERIVYY